MLHKKFGVEVVNFADENPAADQKAWKSFLEGSDPQGSEVDPGRLIRADSIVRDANHLHLYKKAGFERLLLGIENYDQAVLERINGKRPRPKWTEKAIRLLRRKTKYYRWRLTWSALARSARGIFIAALGNSWITTLTRSSFCMSHLTSGRLFLKEIKGKRVIQADQSKWDYKHQVVAMENLKPWMVLLYVKSIEAIMKCARTP